MTRTQRILLVSLGVILVLVIFNYLVYAPAQAQYQSLLTRREQLQAERDRLRNIAQQREVLEREFTELQATVPTLEAKLPAEKDVPVLLVQLEQLASAQRISLSNIAIGSVAQAQPPAAGTPAPVTVGTVSLGLSVTATYQQLIELLAQLHDFPRLLAVKSLTIGPETLPKLAVQINAETYVLAREGAR